ncbi:hypothetical protein KFK09_001289 [Dendrobium nobile]|uniref:Uncharacterized protein n=1 Tax=Dendrobium nobile TaxID=94219 RepID=A0A8T3C6V6_DENNO|nr:hypothetical protein KFK09_001289 [Dendrobium nobile]
MEMGFEAFVSGVFPRGQTEGLKRTKIESRRRADHEEKEERTEQDEQRGVAPQGRFLYSSKLYDSYVPFDYTLPITYNAR